MIVLKHLAREFNIDPHKLRMILRSLNLEPKNRRWKWEEDSEQLNKVRAHLLQHIAGSFTLPSQKHSLTIPSPSKPRQLKKHAHAASSPRK